MSHVDEGRLHAWLDGAYEEPALASERAEIEAHLAACASCRAALEQERALRDRAAGVLRAAAPAATSPAWEDVLARRRAAAPARTRRRFPLAWAASIVLAVGAGWIASRVLGPEQAASFRDEATLESAAEPSAGMAGAASREEAETDAAAPVMAPPAGEPVTSGPDRTRADDALERQALGDLQQNVRVETRGQRDEQAGMRAAPTTAAAKIEALEVVAVPGAELLTDYDRAVLSDAWSDATMDAAAAVLGRPPAVLEGAAIEALQIAESERGSSVLVVQRLDPFTLLELVQRREPVAGEAAAAAGDIAGSVVRQMEVPDSLFVLATDPDRGAAVVALRRGDVTVLLRSAIAVDSLRALAPRIRD